MFLPSFEADKSGTETSETDPPLIDSTLYDDEENSEGDSGEVDIREGIGGEGNNGEVDGGEGNSGEMNSGEGDSGDVNGGEGDSGEVDGGKGDSGEVDGGERERECESNLYDGEQLLHHENTMYIRFTLLQWVCILFVRLQLRFGLTNAAAMAILAFVSLLLDLITHPLHSFSPIAFYFASLDNFTEKQVFIVCPNDSYNSLYSLEGISRGGTAMQFQNVWQNL